MKTYSIYASNHAKLFIKAKINTTNRVEAAKTLRECREAGYKYINYCINDSEHVLGSVMVRNWGKTIYHKTGWAHR